MSEKRSCVDCGILNCQTRDREYPEFCLTTELAPETVDKVRRLYEDEENNRVSVVSAQIENEFYLQYTRLQEVMEFSKRMGFHKIGDRHVCGPYRGEQDTGTDLKKERIRGVRRRMQDRVFSQSGCRGV